MKSKPFSKTDNSAGLSGQLDRFTTLGASMDLAVGGSGCTDLLNLDLPGLLRKRTACSWEAVPMEKLVV